MRDMVGLYSWRAIVPGEVVLPTSIKALASGSAGLMEGGDQNNARIGYPSLAIPSSPITDLSPDTQCSSASSTRWHHVPDRFDKWSLERGGINF